MFTRYADDITISGDGSFTRRELDTVYRILKEEGFKPNFAKERTSRRGASQMVTGLVVNEKVAVCRRDRKRIRAIFYQARNFPKDFVARISELQGYVSWLKQIDSTRPEIGNYFDIINQLKCFGNSADT